METLGREETAAEEHEQGEGGGQAPRGAHQGGTHQQRW